MAKQLLAKEVTAAMIEKLQARVGALKEKGVTPKLGIIRCGENPSDLSYERGATKRADEIGVAGREVRVARGCNQGSVDRQDRGNQCG